jgi:TonB family protein
MKFLTKITQATFILTLLAANNMATAQQNILRFDEMEQYQDSVELLYEEIYTIIDKNPTVLYDFEYDNNQKPIAVSVTGIEDAETTSIMKEKLMKLQLLKQHMFNISNRMGIYYVAETNAEPTEGFVDFYKDINNTLDYPEEASDFDKEGTVFVKFIVDSNGNISNVQSSNNFENKTAYLTELFVEHAVMAVKSTSGEWKPATVGGFPVAQWKVIPIQFKLDKRTYYPLNYTFSD